MRKYQILVNLDAIFDTVQGCMENHNEKYGNRLLCSEYVNRRHNNLTGLVPEVTTEEFKKLFEDRDVHTLRKSISNGVLVVLRDVIRDQISGDEEDPLGAEVCVVINTHPYELSPSETKEMFMGLKEILKPNSLLTVSMSLKEITPSFLKGAYDQFIMEDFSEWTTLHVKEFDKCVIPGVLCTAPLLLTTETENSKETFENLNMRLTGSFLPILALDLLRPLVYSLTYKEKKK